MFDFFTIHIIEFYQQFLKVFNDKFKQFIYNIFELFVYLFKTLILVTNFHPIIYSSNFDVI